MVSHITVSFAFVSFCFVSIRFVFCFFFSSFRFVVASRRNCPMNVCGCGMHIVHYISHIYVFHIWTALVEIIKKNQRFKRQNAIQCCSTIIIQIRYDEFWSVSNAHSIFVLRITLDGCISNRKYTQKIMWRVICETK